MLEKVQSLILGAKICDSCRKELAQLAVESDPLDNSGNEFDSTYIESLESVNECLQAIGETPIIKKKLVNTNYPKKNKNCSCKSHVTYNDAI